jgi:hypothetical protein
MPPEFLFLYARLDYACNIFLKEIAAIQQKKIRQFFRRIKAPRAAPNYQEHIPAEGLDIFLGME